LIGILIPVGMVVVLIAFGVVAVPTLLLVYALGMPIASYLAIRLNDLLES